MCVMHVVECIAFSEEKLLSSAWSGEPGPKGARGSSPTPP
jgi:hypothetical protein